MRPSSKQRRLVHHLPAAGIPLAVCKSCSPGAAAEKAFRIISPMPSVYVAEDGVSVRLDLNAGPGVQWFVDGEFLGEINGKQAFVPGIHRVDAVRTEDSATDSVVFTVTQKR